MSEQPDLAPVRVLDVDDWEDEDAVTRAFAEALVRQGLPDWQREEVERADLIESGLGTRFLEVEADETPDAYRRSGG